MIATSPVLVIVVLLTITGLLTPEALVVKGIFLIMLVGLTWKEGVVHLVDLILSVASRSAGTERGQSSATSKPCVTLLRSDKSAGSLLQTHS